MGKLFRFIRYFFYGFAIWTIFTYNSSFHYVDPRLKETVDEIQNTMKEACSPHKYYYPKKTIIGIGKLKDGTAGECSIYKNGNFKIVINEKEYDKLFSKHPDLLYQVVAHELTHCELGLDHSENPTSYMKDTINHLIPKPFVFMELVVNSLNACKNGDVK